MALKKSELYSSLWRSCDELRGGMDASQYKDYVLVLLFVKYVSDKAAGSKDYLLNVPEGGGFKDMVAVKGDPEIGDKINKIISKLAKENGLEGVIDQTDFNDPEKLGKGKEMVDRLSNLVAIFDTPELDFRGNRAEGDDLLGDAYEYLMRHFATESGKSKGQFYTPAEVSRVMSKVLGFRGVRSETPTIYDPTCGSGSLLLKAHDEAKSVSGRDFALFGQEMDNATAALAKMNMWLHDCGTAEIWQDNVLAAPYFKDKDRLKTFDFIVANPPFSFKSWSSGVNVANDKYERFTLGGKTPPPPAKNGDMAFLMHILASLKTTGKAAVNLPHGVLFRGNAEAAIRREIVSRGYVKGIIGLPPNLFYGTGIAACILVLDKEGAAERKAVFMIDASRGFVKDGNKNRLRAQDIHKIVDTFTRQVEIPRYSRLVPLTEIADAKNAYNLYIPRYIDSSEPEDLQNIDAHLRGGIPVRDVDAQDRYWKVFPGVRAALFKPADRPSYYSLAVAPADVKATIFGHTEFTMFNETVTGLFAKWKKANTPKLKGIAVEDRPKALIHLVSEHLLKTFEAAPLVDPYDVYQHLMTYWADVMQDDMYAVSHNGWVGAVKPQLIVEEKGKKSTTKPDLVVGKKKFKIELVPPALIVARYYEADRLEIERWEAEAAKAVQALDELKDEHGSEEGLLAEVIDEKGKITKGALTARLKAIRGDKEFADEREVLERYAALLEEESKAWAKASELQAELDEKVLAKYGSLTEDEVKTLVVDDKWLATLAADVQSELDRVSQTLTGRVKQLAERYATPMPQLSEKLDALSARVAGHLKKMGASWK
jgi:type I restriction enzyme M protein